MLFGYQIWGVFPVPILQWNTSKSNITHIFKIHHMTCFEKQVYLPFFRKVDIVSYNLGVFFHIYRKNISTSFLNLATNFRRKFFSNETMDKKYSVPVKGLDTASSHFTCSQVCFQGADCFLQVLHKEKIAQFLPQSVGSFIVGGISQQKEIQEFFPPLIQVEEGRPWFYRGPVSGSTVSKWQYMSYLTTYFYVTFF